MKKTEPTSTESKKALRQFEISRARLLKRAHKLRDMLDALERELGRRRKP